jgi:hypothetical protein
MNVLDDGRHLVIASPAPWYVRWPAGFFAAMSVLYVVMILHGLLASKSIGSVDCDRARGTCEVTIDSARRRVLVADVVKAVWRHDQGHKNSSPSDVAGLQLRDGSTRWLGEPAYQSGPIAAYRDAVAGLSAFIADPAQARFHAEYVARDEDWVYMIAFALLLPLFAFVFLRMAVSTRVAVDRAERSLEATEKPMFRKGVTSRVAFADVAAVTVTGSARWAWLGLRTQSGILSVARFPRTPASEAGLRELSGKLAQTLAVPIARSPAIRESWRLGV